MIFELKSAFFKKSTKSYRTSSVRSLEFISPRNFFSEISRELKPNVPCKSSSGKLKDLEHLFKVRAFSTLHAFKSLTINFFQESLRKNKTYESELNRLKKRLYESLTRESFQSSGIHLSPSAKSRGTQQERPASDFINAEIVNKLNEEMASMTEENLQLRERGGVQSERIESLERDVEILRTAVVSAENLIFQLRAENDSFITELQWRPTAKQWRLAQAEINLLETKLDNLVKMKQEEAEVFAWKHHLPANEQIAIDKRNHMLGLWQIDSLPQPALRELVKSVCRELDLGDSSEIIRSIQKLKSVVLTVPRMENFISSICSFLTQRCAQLSPLVGEDLKDVQTIDSALRTLRKWWAIVVHCVELEGFNHSVTFELYRASALLEVNSSEMEPEEITFRELWEQKFKKLWMSKDKNEIISRIRELATFQHHVLSDPNSRIQIEEKLGTRPDILTYRILKHIEYLFGINQVDEILPTLNSFYLEHEEFKQFLKIGRSLMGNISSNSELLGKILEVLNHRTN
jgi:hypothetical protein